MTLSTFAIERWLEDTLEADPALAGRVHGRLIPRNASLDGGRCVFEPVSNLSVLGIGASHVMDNALYRVKVVGKAGGIGALRTMARAIYSRLHDQTGSNADGAVWGCAYEEDEAIPPDIVNGVTYLTISQRYRIHARGV